MKYILDTNVLISMFRDKYGIREAIIGSGIENCVISEISFAEIMVGAYKTSFKKHQHEIQFLKENFDIVTTGNALEKYAQLRVDLEENGKRVDNFDLLIAATAIANGYILVTHNVKHFSNIKDLKVCDWER